jgi:hypothetical protein
MHKYGFCHFVFNFQEIAHDYDLGLYQVMLNDNSCIHQLLPAKKREIMQPRYRGHCYSLLVCKYDLYKNSFVNQCLYKYVQFCFHCSTSVDFILSCMWACLSSIIKVSSYLMSKTVNITRANTQNSFARNMELCFH